MFDEAETSTVLAMKQRKRITITLLLRQEDPVNQFRIHIPRMLNIGLSQDEVIERFFIAYHMRDSR